MLRPADRFGAWTDFRIGPEPEKFFRETQVPFVPDLLGTSRATNPTWKTLSDLATQLGGAVLLSHSQSGTSPLESALIDAKGIRDVVMVEPGTCNAAIHTDEEIVILAKRAIYILFGDYLSAETKLPGPSWEDRLNDCRASSSASTHLVAMFVSTPGLRAVFVAAATS